MLRDGSGRLWIATLNGLSVLAQGKLHNYTVADGLPGDVITALDISADGNLLVGTAEHGWSIFDHENFLPSTTAPEKATPSSRFFRTRPAPPGSQHQTQSPAAV